LTTTRSSCVEPVSLRSPRERGRRRRGCRSTLDRSRPRVYPWLQERYEHANWESSCSAWSCVDRTRSIQPSSWIWVHPVPTGQRASASVGSVRRLRDRASGCYFRGRGPGWTVCLASVARQDHDLLASVADRMGDVAGEGWLVQPDLAFWARPDWHSDEVCVVRQTPLRTGEVHASLRADDRETYLASTRAGAVIGLAGRDLPEWTVRAWRIPSGDPAPLP
jgi:hypothetical protein